jgi:hypothetical protein
MFDREFFSRPAEVEGGEIGNHSVTPPHVAPSRPRKVKARFERLLSNG